MGSIHLEQRTDSVSEKDAVVIKTPLVKEALRRQLVQSMGLVYGAALSRVEQALMFGNLTKARRRHAKIVEQSRIICEDYIFCRLQGVCSRFPLSDDDVIDEAVDSPTTDSDPLSEDLDQPRPADADLNAVSMEIQHIGAKLELSYPSLYTDLPRHLAMPLRSQVAVRKALICIGDFMFRGQPPVITWCRIVGLFAVAGAIAREVVLNGNPHLIPTVVTTFGELVDCYLAHWIYKQGGWIQVVNEFRIDDPKTRNRVLTTLIGVLSGFVVTWMTLPF